MRCRTGSAASKVPRSTAKYSTAYPCCPQDEAPEQAPAGVGMVGDLAVLHPGYAQPVSVGTTAFSVTYQRRFFSIKITRRPGAFVLARRWRNAVTLGSRQASG